MSENELEMKKLGEDKVWKDIITKAGNSKNISSTQIGQQILLDEALRMLPDVMHWIHKTSGKSYRGLLKAYFTDEQVVLDKITQTFLFLVGNIYYSESLISGRTRHKNISGIQKKVMPELDWDNVYRFLETIVDFSVHFGTDKTNEFDPKKKFNYKYTYTCDLTSVVIQKLADRSAIAFYPMPMTEQPLDWRLDQEGNAVGGYTDYQFNLVRADQRNVNYLDFSQQIYDSINYIQSTPWIVNKEVLTTLKSDLVEPIRSDFVKGEYPDVAECQYEYDLKDEVLVSKLDQSLVAELRVIRKQYNDQVALYRADASDFESALGKYRAIKLAVKIAEKYKDEEVIYFPHSYDFRGRVYPLPIGLTPQGSDAVKALLLYKNVQEVDERGVLWNYAYLASLFGDDKLDFLERAKRGQELLLADYKEADEPYQFLSHQIELQKYEVDNNYIPNTRIHLDACNSGSQFTSSITGDLSGCLATNVMPSYEDDKLVRKDAYMLVAEKALELTGELIKTAEDSQTKQIYEFFYELLTSDGRKICKVPVMVSNYGGTAGGRTEILWNMFRELGVERKWITRKIAAMFSKIIGNSITGTLKGGKAFEEYIHKMNNMVARNNVPVTWTTSDGFKVTHLKKKELKPKQVKCMLPNARKSTIIMKKLYSDKLSLPKMKSAISPNYIHSLDAELLRRVALRMKEEGIVDSDWIHDSFGSHPNDVDLMLDITKEEFADLVKRDPLKILDDELNTQLVLDSATIRLLADCELPRLNEFIMKDVDQIYNSDWFFS